jgi:hypothetical protein
MKLLRLLLVTATTTLGLVVFTQLPASACECAAAEPVQAAAPAPTRSGVLPVDTPSKPPVPTVVPSGLQRVDRVEGDGSLSPWAWFDAGLLIVLAGSLAAVRLRLAGRRRSVRVSRGSWPRQA